MAAYGKAMRPSLVDVMEETNALASEMDKKIVLIVNYHGSVWPATATLEHTDGTTVTYDELASIANTVVIAFDTYLGAAALADIQKQIDDSIEITYQASRYNDTEQAIVYYTVTVHVESGITPTVNVDTDTFSGGSYTLPTASADTLGGVKVGSGLAIDANGVLSASGGSGTAGTVEITENGATLDFDALKAIAQSDNPTVTASIIGTRDAVHNVFSRVIYSSDDDEIIHVITCAVYSNVFDNIGVYWAEIVRSDGVASAWDLSFYDVEKTATNIGNVS